MSEATSWTEVRITIPADQIDKAADIAHMTVPYGIYIEDYRALEEETMEIAHIDLIDEDLLQKDRTKGIVHIYLEPGENPQEAVAFLTARYSAEHIENEIALFPCKDEDWQNNWKKFYEPLPVGETLLIQPSWEDVDPDLAKGRKVLTIEPGLAFGTGSHDTTRLCLTAMEDTIQGGESVLDLGCGSGILSIAALLLGAATVEGVDIDDVAVRTAIENGKLNDMEAPRYTMHCGDMTDQVSGTFDLIVANIVADIIVPFCKTAKSYMHEHSKFIVSGIIDSREDDVKKAFKDNDLTVLERRQSSEWLCFILQ